MTFLDKAHVVFEDALGAPHLRLFTLNFERIAIHQACPQVELGFEQADVFVASAE
jgi:hypothetical protein